MARRRRTAFRRQGQYIWTSAIINNEDVLATTLTTPIVNDADFGDAGARNITLMGIRGWISVSDSALTASSGYFAGILMIDEDVGATSAQQAMNDANVLVNEDILSTWCLQMTDGGAHRTVFDVNVKARRKLKTGQEIRFSHIAGAALRAEVSAVFRAVLKVA